MIKQIAIILSDNDFGLTFTALLKSIQMVLENNPTIGEDRITDLIHMGIEFHYVANQHLNHYPLMEKDIIKSTVNYLKENIKVLYDEDAIEANCSADFDGGAWYLDVIYNQINSF